MVSCAVATSAGCDGEATDECDDIETLNTGFLVFFNFDELNNDILDHLSLFVLICEDIKTLRSDISHFLNLK